MYTMNFIEEIYQTYGMRKIGRTITWSHHSHTNTHKL